MIFSRILKTTLGAAGIAAATAVPVQAAEEVNVGYFLEWATPNLIAKAEQAYEDALGVPVNWTAFAAGTEMTEAMLAGDIDISYSQGLAPFIAGVNSNAPIKMVGIAVAYPANECVVAEGAGITKDNASELEGKTVAVPLATMADYSFRMQMRALDVDIDAITIVDQAPQDGLVSLIEGSVAMACIFGGDTLKTALENGSQLMSAEEAAAANIVSFDVVSVTEKFAAEEGDIVRAFMDVTNEANVAYLADQSKLNVISSESGMDEETTLNQIGTMTFATNEEQMANYFSEGGLAETAIGIVGNAFATDEAPALEDYSKVIDTSFIE